MESIKDHWYETLSPGTVLSLPDIDCSKARIARHSELFDAYHPVNTSTDNRFGRAIAHGPHAVAQAMASVGNLLPNSLVAMSHFASVRGAWPRPRRDLLTADATVIGRGAASRGSGTVILEVRITDPNGRVSQIGEAHLLVRHSHKPKETA